MSMRCLWGVLCCVWLLGGGVVWADSATPPARNASPANKKTAPIQDTITGWTATLNGALTYNGIGLAMIARGGYRWRMFASDNFAFSDNFVRLHLVGQLTPSTGDIGPSITIAPASFLRFGASYGLRGYFPTFTVGTLFESKEALQSHFAGTKDFLDGERRIDMQRDATTQRNGEQLSFLTHIVRLHWLLQFRFAGVVAQWTGVVSWFFHQYEDAADAPLVYEVYNDLVMNKQDQLFTSVLLAGYEWRNFRFLAVMTYALALGTGEDTLGLGPGVQWTIAPNWGPLKEPFLLVAVRWWVKHRFRSGPMPNIGMIFQGSFGPG